MTAPRHADWPDAPVPCATCPDAWDLPPRVGQLPDHALIHVYSRIAAATRICASCPALAACRAWADASPPRGRIQAGVIYGASGDPQTLTHWRRRTPTIQETPA
ncbi:MAG: hypothetical protein ACRDT4_26685 [Micromonosporaceae bacterium]